MHLYPWIGRQENKNWSNFPKRKEKEEMYTKSSLKRVNQPMKRWVAFYQNLWCMYSQRISSMAVTKTRKYLIKRFFSLLSSIDLRLSLELLCLRSSKLTTLSGWDTTPITRMPSISREKTNLSGGVCSSGFSKTFSSLWFGVISMLQKSRRNIQEYSIIERTFGVWSWEWALKTCFYRIYNESRKEKWSTNVRAITLLQPRWGWSQRMTLFAPLWLSTENYPIIRTWPQIVN